jgi:hypothetical protein
VKFRQVLLPFAIIIACRIVVLLLVWQLVDPLRWEPEHPEAFDLTGGGGSVSYGYCTSADKGLAPFLVPLAVLFALVIIMSLMILWKMREAQEEFTDVKSIFIGIITHLQVWAVGIPVYLVLHDVSMDTAYLSSVVLVFFFSNVVVVVVIGPKIVMDLSYTRKSRRLASSRGSGVGGGMTHISGLYQGSFASQQSAWYVPSSCAFNEIKATSCVLKVNCGLSPSRLLV